MEDKTYHAWVDGMPVGKIGRTLLPIPLPIPGGSPVPLSMSDIEAIEQCEVAEFRRSKARLVNYREVLHDEN